ncbi:MAG: nuclear transport factor 2 family protein [Bdellovibrionaceae bacterium]|nr:nuclear transport factor 2 family protein [Bdellovibrionales bacterium]MCB9253670.1 nuclear transport factor 2 family protein [Pseudobdellovibrionaceae bacterium]
METPANLFSLFLESLGGRTSRFCEQLSDSVVLDTPITGKAVGRLQSEDALNRLSAWFRDYNARLEYGRTVAGSDGYAAAEGKAFLQLDGWDVGVPLAVAMDLNPSQKLTGFRLYHTLWPVKHAHTLRGPLFDSERATLPKDVADYHHALENGDAAKAAGLFESDGTVREPSGGISGGRETPLSRFFEWAFQAGGVSLHYHRLVDSGSHVAAEYTCYRWANKEIPPQAGMEFWDRSDSGLFRAVRIYDDVEQPS